MTTGNPDDGAIQDLDVREEEAHSVKGGAKLFLDEADSLFGGREDGEAKQ